MDACLRSRDRDLRRAGGIVGNTIAYCDGVAIELLGAVVFVGGSDNPYNYNGVGYNGEPSQPVAGFLL